MTIDSYGLRQHRSTLKESLNTHKQITRDEFNRRLTRYHLYEYDPRCSQILFIANEMEQEYFTWMYIQLAETEDPTWKQFKEDQARIIYGALKKGIDEISENIEKERYK